MDTGLNMNPMTVAAPGIALPDAEALAAQHKAEQAEREQARAADFARFWKAAAVFAVLYVVCLYKNHSGITYPFFMAAMLYLTHRYHKRDGIRTWQGTRRWKLLRVFYMAALMLLSLSKCTTASAPLLFFDGVAICLLSVCYLLHLFVDVNAWGIAQHMRAMCAVFLAPAARVLNPFLDAAAFWKLRPATDGARPKRLWTPVLIGVAISVPLLFVVMALLSSADVVFRTLVDRMMVALRLESIPDFVTDIVKVTLTGAGAFVVCYALLSRLTETRPFVKEGSGKRFAAATAITVSLLLGVVYAVFSFIQIAFLFIGNMTLPQGYTYAEYVHEGFDQLLFVSALNLLLVLLGKNLFEKSKALQGMLTFISLCTYIMIASGALRMVMYVRAYHLSFQRVLVLWFLAVLAVLLTGLIVSIYLERFALFTFGVVTVSVLYLALALAHPDYHIARYNLARYNTPEAAEADEEEALYTRNGYLDESYLWWGLSQDAVPALVQDKAQMAAAAKTGTTAFNGRQNQTVAWEYRTLLQKVRGFNFSEWYAWYLLRGI